MPRRRSAVNFKAIGFVLLLTTSAAYSQNPAPESRGEFDVASIKPVRNAAPNAQMSGDIDHGKITMDNAALRSMIGVAYDIQRVRVVGGPDWLDSDRYQIDARSDDAHASEAQLRLMLQRLLEGRFKLRVHKENKLLPTYTLLKAHGGSKLQKAKEGGNSNCAFTTEPPRSQLVCQKTPILGLINFLANMLRSPVIDKTELSGSYDFTFTWETGDADFDSVLPGALNEIGLKLESKKAPTEIVIVDSAERASEN
jgi:uncharacterized protein (TIGR03435 family)